MSIIEWKNPPRNKEDDWDDLAEELRARPNDWALVAEKASIVDGNIVDGLECRDLETKTIHVAGLEGFHNARYDVYARFVPKSRS